MQGLTEIIADILLNDDMARNSDAYLYHAVCKKINPAALSVPFGVVIQDPKGYKIPGYDTVSRLRRKVQSEWHFVDLSANTQVSAWRSEREQRARMGCFE